MSLYAYAALAIILSNGSLDRAKAIDIVNRAINAHGGEDRIKSMTAFKAKTSGEHCINDIKISYTGNIVFMAPDRLKYDIEYSILEKSFKTTLVIKDQDCCLLVNGVKSSVQMERNSTLRAIIRNYELTTLFSLKNETKYILHYLPEDVYNKIRYYRISMKPLVHSNSNVCELYFDTNTCLLSIIKRKVVIEKKEKSELIILSDYKKIQGIHVANSTVIMLDNKEIGNNKYIDLELFPKMAESEFEK